MSAPDGFTCDDPDCTDPVTLAPFPELDGTYCVAHTYRRMVDAGHMEPNGAVENAL